MTSLIFIAPHVKGEFHRTFRAELFARAVLKDGQ